MMVGSLIAAYEQMHREGRFSGHSLKYHVDQVAELVRETATATILDYGCGKGKQYSERRMHDAWGIMPTLYDPAVPELRARPIGTFHGVVCTDVLEHIPMDELDGVIADLNRYAERWCFVSVCCRAAKKKLPDGRNAHVTLRKSEWWRATLCASWRGPAALHVDFTP